MAKAKAPQPPGGPPPGGLTSSLAMILIGVGTKLREHLDDQLAAHDITTRHLGALGHLSASPELSSSDLARRVRVTSQSMRATVDQLEAIGAVEHRRHGRGRASELLVTDTGRRILQDARTLVFDLDESLLSDVDNTQQLRDALLGVMLQLAAAQTTGNTTSPS